MGHQAQSEGEEGIAALGTMEFLFCVLYLRLTRSLDLFKLLPIVVRSQGTVETVALVKKYSARRGVRVELWRPISISKSSTRMHR
jgi:hypothetical protein